MAIKIIEIIATSPKGFHTAFENGVKEMTAKHNVTGVKIVGHTADVKKGRITEYKVNLKVACKE